MSPRGVVRQSPAIESKSQGQDLGESMRCSLRLAAILGVALAALLPAHPGLAWGPEAHRTIALIGDRILQQSDAAVRGKIGALLKTDKDSPLTKTDIASEAT